MKQGREEFTAHQVACGAQDNEEVRCYSVVAGHTCFSLPRHRQQPVSEGCLVAGAGTSRSIASKTVHYPSPESAT